MSPRTGGRPALTSSAKLLDAARQLGFRDLGVEAVTRRAGVKYSTFYRHWPNIAALTRALVEDVLRPLTEPPPPTAAPSSPAPAGNEAPAAGDEPTDWAERLTDTCAALAEIIDSHPGMAATLAGLTAMPAQLDRTHRRLTDGLVAAGFARDDAVAVVSTALRTTIAAATGTTALFVVPGPDVGLPQVILTGLEHRRREHHHTDGPEDPR